MVVYDVDKDIVDAQIPDDYIQLMNQMENVNQFIKYDCLPSFFHIADLHCLFLKQAYNFNVIDEETVLRTLKNLKKPQNILTANRTNQVEMLQYFIIVPWLVLVQNRK